MNEIYVKDQYDAEALAITLAKNNYLVMIKQVKIMADQEEPTEYKVLYTEELK